ncbi:hypothetical protein EV360DRAFT_89526 [Lentinula raphanica]|nr:hypothetical protein EV360DRAFT_89526 [Lentinula raphanica]
MSIYIQPLVLIERHARPVVHLPTALLSTLLRPLLPNASVLPPVRKGQTLTGAMCLPLHVILSVPAEFLHMIATMISQFNLLVTGAFTPTLLSSIKPNLVPAFHQHFLPLLAMPSLIPLESIQPQRLLLTVSFAPANIPGKGVSLGGGSSSAQATTSHYTSTQNATLEPKKKIPLFLDSDSDDDDDDKIPKPLGEAGRPGRGGYNLRDALNWPEERYGKVKRYINGIVQDKLECTLPYTEQPLLALKQVRDLATAKYPFLTQYRDNWPIDDFIRSQLKYRKAALQKEAVETELADIRNRATKSGKRSGRKGEA